MARRRGDHRLTSGACGVAMLAALAGLCDNGLAKDVPFAYPEPRADQVDASSLISLANIMSILQLRHIKLWYAGRARDWALVDFELDRIVEDLRRAATLYTGIPVPHIIATVGPIETMREAVKRKDQKAFDQGYAAMTASCNACHIAGQVGFIRLQTPTVFPFTDQAIGEKTPR